MSNSLGARAYLMGRYDTTYILFWNYWLLFSTEFENLLVCIDNELNVIRN